MVYRKIQLPFKIKKPVLALGSQTKNTVCFAKGDFAYLSQVHPDLSNPLEFSKFEKEVKHFLKLYPEIIAYDLHPDYQSTKYAQGLNFKPDRLRLVQHHHAHIASCMAENSMKNQKVIGVSFDGTGMGGDYKIWGAEFLICDYKNYERKAHLKEVPLLGGERAILEPWRLAAAWLYLAYKDRFLNLGIGFVKGLDKKKWKILKELDAKDINSPLASSMGRLFDAVASLVLAKYKANFEAELAIELEKMGKAYTKNAGSYKFKIEKNNHSYLVSPVSIFKEIVQDLKANETRQKIAYRFHLTVAEIIRSACLK